MDLLEAYGGSFGQTAPKEHTRIKNLEPDAKPQPQGTSILPEDLNPRPSSVPRVHVIDERPRPRILGTGLGKSIGQIVTDSMKNAMGSLGSHGSGMSPEIYLVQFHISRNDCHTICLFLLVFIISFLMSSRK